MFADFAFYFAELCKNTHFTEETSLLCIQKMSKWGAWFAEKRGVKRISRCQNLHFSHVSQTYGFFWKIWLILVSKIIYHSETPHISTQNTVFSFDKNDA